MSTNLKVASFINEVMVDKFSFELAYAHPFSSAKDPVNMVGYVAENIINLEGDVIPVDCSGLQCPGPIMKVNQSMDGLEEAQVISLKKTDWEFSSSLFFLMEIRVSMI